MGLKSNIILKRTVIISLIGFSILITAGITLVFTGSMKRDKEYVEFVRLIDKAENEILTARSCMDEILLSGAYNLHPLLLHSLDSVRVHLNKMNGLVSGKYHNSQDVGIGLFSTNYNEILENLDRIEYKLGDGPEKIRAGDSALFNAFDRSILEFKDLQSLVPGYLILDNLRYKKEIVGIILFNFALVLLSGFFIIRLINQLIKADRMLIRKTIEVETRERERIAADLHDSLGSLLSGLIIHIQVLKKESGSNPALNEKLSHLNQLANDSLVSIEEIINNLSPSMLSRLGLVHSLINITERINDLGKTRFLVNAEKLTSRLPESHELLLYRICSELINNALKHSLAEKAEFLLYDHKQMVHLVYRDNGVGFDPAVSTYEENKSGLYNLIRRVESMDGRYTIHSGSGKGVEIRIMFNIR
jgi:signal transduction histidine kinase